MLVVAFVVAATFSVISIQQVHAFGWAHQTTLSQTTGNPPALLYLSGTLYMAYGMEDSSSLNQNCCPDIGILSSTDMSSWTSIGRVSGASLNPGKTSLAYNPVDRKMYLAFLTTGQVLDFVYCGELTCGGGVASVPTIAVSSSSNGIIWTTPTNVTVQSYNLNNAYGLDMVGPSIAFDSNNNRLILAYAYYYSSCNCQRVFLQQSYGPNFNQGWTPVSSNPVTYGGSQLNVLSTPDMKFINGKLYMAYVANDQTMHVIQSTDGITWSNKGDVAAQTGYFVALDYSPLEPAFHLDWVGTDSSYTINDMSSNDAVSWNTWSTFDGGLNPLAESRLNPSLALDSATNVLVLAFTGTDGSFGPQFCPCRSGHLNVMHQSGANSEAAFVSYGGSPLFATSSQTVSNLESTQGTFLDQNAPTATFCCTAITVVGSSTVPQHTQADEYDSLNGFSLSIPSNSIITSATITLIPSGTEWNQCVIGCQVSFFAITSTWNAAQTDWYNQPSTSCFSGCSFNTLKSQGMSGTWTIDVTRIVRDAFTNGQFYGIEVKPTWHNEDFQVDWFDSNTNKPPTLSVTYTAIPSTATMCAGQQAPVTVTMQNTGYTKWLPASSYPSFPFRLGSQNPRDNTYLGLSRVDLSQSVLQGSSVTFSFTVTAPSVLGTYGFQWQMVQDGVTWFGALTPNIQVVVNACSLSASSTPNSIPADGTSISTITVQTPDNQANLQISFSSSIGSLSGSSCITGSGGSCSVAISSASQGTATITATANGWSASTTSVSFTPPPSFTVTTSPQIQTANIGATATSAITLNPLNGFSGTVNFGVSSGGASCSISPTSVSIPPSPGSATLSCSSSTSGKYSVSVTVTSGSLTRSTSVLLVVGLAFQFRDNFTYGFTSQMAPVGWSTYGSQSVGGGTLTLVNDGSSGSADSWTKVPSGVGNWTVALTAEWVGGSYGTLHLEASTAHHNYIWGVDGVYKQYIFYRDGAYILIGSNIPQQGVWHTLRMDMVNGKISMYFDGTLITTYTETDPVTTLTQFGPDAGWRSTDSFNLIQASALKYTLTLVGYDYDGAQEETLTLNNQLLAKLPAVNSPGGKNVTFTLDMTSLAVRGTNTLTFTHANWDCNVVDTTSNVKVTDATGAIIFSDPTRRPLSCTQSITYTFTI